MRRRILWPALAAVAALALAAAVRPQWSEDPAANLVLSDRPGEQVQPKVVARADGGAYVSWFDNADGGYDVYLQRLDAGGVEQWAENGILVADRGFSSTQDYGLSIDTAGNALLVYRDDSGPLPRVTAAKVSPAGALLWGAGGVVLIESSLFLAAPAIAGTSDGGAVAAWTRGAEVAAQKLDPAGTPLWGAGVTLTSGGTSLALADVRAAEAGHAIVSMVETLGAISPRHLLAQKLDGTTGASLWGAGHVAVYDAAGGSLQIGAFPDFVADGAGGAVFAWYTSSPSLQCRVQRVLAAGTEAFAHNGVEVSTEASRLRVSPAAALDPATGETFAFWVETDQGQSQSGLWGQKLDATGARQWSDSGREIVALGSSQISFVQVHAVSGGARVAWIDSLSFGDDPIRGTRVDGAGDFLWSPPVVDLATSATSSSRLASAASSAGFGIYAWSDGATGAADILAQNLNLDGSLGPASLFADGFESGDLTSWAATSP